MSWRPKFPEKQPKDKDEISKYREKRYLQKVRLCTNLKDYNWCPWGAKCLFAHSLAELRLPDEGPNAMFAWSDVWQRKPAEGKGGVHKWYCQELAPEDHEILKWQFNRKIGREPLKVPDWAIAYAIVHMEFKPFRAPNEAYWGLPDQIEAPRALRGGRLPPGVPPT